MLSLQIVVVLKEAAESPADFVIANLLKELRKIFLLIGVNFFLVFNQTLIFVVGFSPKPS